MSDAKIKIKIKVKNAKLQGILKNFIGTHNPPAQDGQGGHHSHKPGYGANSTQYMGRGSAFKPATSSDKKMSDKHISHRKEVDGLPKYEALKKSIKYNKEHAKEHKQALKVALKKAKELKN